MLLLAVAALRRIGTELAGAGEVVVMTGGSSTLLFISDGPSRKALGGRILTLDCSGFEVAICTKLGDCNVFIVFRLVLTEEALESSEKVNLDTNVESW